MKVFYGLVIGIIGGGKIYFLFYVICELFCRYLEVCLLDLKVLDLSFMKCVIGDDKVVDIKG